MMGEEYFDCMLPLPPMLRAGSSFPAAALQISYFKSLPWQPNKMVAGQKTYKLGSNYQMSITAKYNSHHFTGYRENGI